MTLREVPAPVREPNAGTQIDAAAKVGAGPAAADDVARTAGRGGLAVAAAKIYFILVGLVQQILLKWVLGLDGYGALSSALSMASVSYNPMVTTSIQGVSRAVASSQPEVQPEALRRTFFFHAGSGLLLGVGFFLLAPVVARAIGAPHIVTALRLLSLVLAFYGVYTPLVGALNGKRRFIQQAGLDMGAATLRTLGLIGGAYLFARAATSQGSGFGGIEGAVSGFVLAALAVMLVALRMVGTGRSGAGGPSMRQHVLFILPLFAGQVLLNLLFQADLFLLRMFAAGAAESAGLSLLAADPLVGAYRAMQLFCFLPYQLLLSITFILFPLLASAHRDGDKETVARYVRTGVRVALLIMGLLVSVISGLSGPLLTLVFGADAAALASEAMHLLSLGFGAFAIFGILTTVLNSLERERSSALITALAFGLVVALCWLFVRDTAFGEDIIYKTATFTSVGIVLATLAAATLVYRTAGGLLAPLSLVRVAIAMALAIAVGRNLPELGKLWTPVLAVAVAVVYCVILLAVRELGTADWETVRAIVKKQRGAQG